MTVLNQTDKVTKTGNGVAVDFSFSPLVVFEPDVGESHQIQVVITNTITGTETMAVEGTGPSNYSVTVATYPGTGSVRYPADSSTPLAATQTITIAYNLTLEQQTRFRNQGGYNPKNLENALDRGILILIQQQEQLNRVLKASITDTVVDLTLPNATERANLALVFDATGKPIAGSTTGTATSAFMATVLDDADGAAALTTLGLPANAVTFVQSANYAAMRAALGVAIGTDVQAFDVDTAKTDVAQEYTRQQNFNAVEVTALGSELVTEGDFSSAGTNWTLGLFWGVASGVANINGAQSADSDIEQDIAITVGNTYQVEFTISSYVAGTLTPYVGGTAGTARSANGTYIETIVAGAGGAPRFELRANSTGNFGLDDVKCQEAHRLWDLDTEQCLILTLDGTQITIPNPSNPKAGSTYILQLKQDATGGRTVVFGSAYKFPGGVAPTLSSAPNAKDIITFFYDGTDMNGVATRDFQ